MDVEQAELGDLGAGETHECFEGGYGVAGAALCWGRGVDEL